MINIDNPRPLKHWLDAMKTKTIVKIRYICLVVVVIAFLSQVIQIFVIAFLGFICSYQLSVEKMERREMKKEEEAAKFGPEEG